MRIITINIPDADLFAIDNLTGNEGLYPSRSELVRVAVREFLISKLKLVEQFKALTAKDVGQAQMELEKTFIQRKVQSQKEEMKIMGMKKEPVSINPNYEDFRGTNDCPAFCRINNMEIANVGCYICKWNKFEQTGRHCTFYNVKFGMEAKK